MDTEHTSRRASIILILALVLCGLACSAWSGEPEQEVIRKIVGSIVQSLVSKSSDEDLGKVASWSPDSIGEVSASSIPQYIADLKDREFKVRGTAATALGLLGPDASEAVPALRERLNDKSGAVKASAAGAIWSITGEGEEMEPILVRLLGGKTKAYHIYAANALGAVGPPAGTAVPALLKCLKVDQFPAVRASAVIALLKIGVRDDAVIQGLTAAQNDKDEQVRRAAAQVLEALLSPPSDSGSDMSPADNGGAQVWMGSGAILYKPGSTEEQMGAAGGEVGTISISVNEGRADGEIEMEIREKLFYMTSETVHKITCSFSGKQSQSSGQMRLFECAGDYVCHTDSDGIGTKSSGNAAVEFRLMNDGSGEGAIRGVQSWGVFTFTVGR